MLNKNNLMMLFTAMYFLSCSVSVDNIASDSIISLKMCFFSINFDVCNLYVAKQSLVFH